MSIKSAKRYCAANRADAVAMWDERIIRLHNGSLLLRQAAIDTCAAYFAQLPSVPGDDLDSWISAYELPDSLPPDADFRQMISDCEIQLTAAPPEEKLIYRKLLSFLTEKQMRVDEARAIPREWVLAELDRVRQYIETRCGSVSAAAPQIKNSLQSLRVARCRI